MRTLTLSTIILRLEDIAREREDPARRGLVFKAVDGRALEELGIELIIMGKRMRNGED